MDEITRLLFLCLVVLFKFELTTTEIKHICFGSTENLYCHERGKLTIHIATYGRNERNICDQNVSWFIWCPLQSVTNFVKGKCENENSCQVTANFQTLRLDNDHEEESCKRVQMEVPHFQQHKHQRPFNQRQKTNLNVFVNSKNQQ